MAGGMGLLQLEQPLEYFRKTVDVDVVVEADVMHVAPHFVIGALQSLVHIAPSTCRFSPPKVLVATTVHARLQSLAVLGVQEDEDAESDYIELVWSESEADGSGSSGPISLRASTIGLRRSCKSLTMPVVP